VEPEGKRAGERPGQGDTADDGPTGMAVLGPEPRRDERDWRQRPETDELGRGKTADWSGEECIVHTGVGVLRGER